jgi:hypothetical protein
MIVAFARENDVTVLVGEATPGRREGDDFELSHGCKLQGGVRGAMEQRTHLSRFPPKQWHPPIRHLCSGNLPEGQKAEL